MLGLVAAGAIAVVAIAWLMRRVRALRRGAPNTWRIRRLAAHGLQMGVVVEALGDTEPEVVAVLRAHAGLGPRTANDLLQGLPGVVARCLEPTAAERLRLALAAAGATARLAAGPELQEFELVLEVLASPPAGAIRRFRAATGADPHEAQAFVAAAPTSVKRLPVARLAAVAASLTAAGDEVREA